MNATDFCAAELPIRITTLKLRVLLARFWGPAKQQNRARQQADI
jgi:hypothetical protein